MPVTGRGNGLVTRCPGQPVPCLHMPISEERHSTLGQMLTLWWIQLVLDIVQHVPYVDLSGVVPHDCLEGDRRVRHISLFEVIHEAFGIINVGDILDATSRQVKLCKYIADVAVSDCCASEAVTHLSS